ncbi:MAG: M3 family metallopeptidase [Pseudomonadales bacterium]|nr:M3 family metallopeptidase [Pseudomonadales bacterium]
MTNPFFETWDTPWGIPPFDRIHEDHFEEAFERAFSEHKEEIARIRESDEAPDFENTIEALERSGSLLEKVGGTFFNFTSSRLTERLQEIQGKIMPAYATHHTGIYSDPALFDRVNRVVESVDRDRLSGEQIRLMEETHKAFVRAGAALDDDARVEVQKLDEQLAELKTRFGQNLVRDTNDFELVLEDKEDLAGLPRSVLNAAASAAEGRNKPGKYVFTTSRSSITPFLKFADRRDLRERIFKAYVNNGNNGNEHDNNDLLSRIAALRAKRAKLLGYENHAAYMLDDRMAGSAERVKSLLDRIWVPAKEKVKREAEDLQSRIQEEGGNFTLEPWDWWYYTEKLRKDRFDFDAEDAKPYFKLENVRDGAFEVAGRLYGITFHRVDDVPVYDPDVQVYEVRENDGTNIGIFMVDYFMRDTKRGGAWMNAFRSQSGETRPIIVNCCNFSKSDPCLLDMDEVRTLFHEFGHGLHGLLSDVKYRSLAGTSVKKDFVELPSQIMEHWATEPEVMKRYARHYETGEPIPDEIIEKIRATATFNQGFATTEYLAASYLDMAWHSLEIDEPVEARDLEKEAMDEIGLVDQVHPRYHSSYFQHIFSGDSYSAGYYVYIWAEVLDADGFEAFREKGIFDEETARAFRRHVLERGGTEDPMTLYKRFRGREPEVQPLLRNRGLA